MFRIALASAALVFSAAACAENPPAAAQTLLVGNKGEDSVSFVDLKTGKELGRSPTGKAPHEIAISPDGKQGGGGRLWGQEHRHFRHRQPRPAEVLRPGAQ